MKQDPVSAKESIKSLLDLKKEGFSQTEIEEACVTVAAKSGLAVGIKSKIEDARLQRILDGENNDTEILAYAEKIGPSARDYAEALLLQINSSGDKLLQNLQRKKIRDLLTLQSPSTSPYSINIACKQILEKQNLRLSLSHMVDVVKRTA